MPYLILVIGLIIGFYTLYRFFLNANVDQIKALFATSLTVIFSVALLFLALTGKLIAALVGLVGAVPILIRWYKTAQDRNKPSDTEPKNVDVIDIEEIKPEDEEDKDKN